SSQQSAVGSQHIEKNTSKLLRKVHQTIKKVTHDIEADYHFNTAIAALMELVNEISSLHSEKWPEPGEDRAALSFAVKNTLLMLAPFAPHISEELWAAIGEKNSVFEHPWPVWDESLAKEEEVELVVQINGKLRAKIPVSAGLSDEDARERSLADPKVKEILNGKEIKKIVVVKGRLVNIVAG
ncbi:MAG: class I tRNA ligase family protein, partial [Nitrospirae bacterium]|nr:class I tRNA ligase family protein [Nitrospirota bacterium]